MGVPADRIALIGPRRAGKTTVGQRLAAILGRSFADLDVAIANETGSTPAEWIGARGIDAFRAAEGRALRSVLTGPSQIIATGGGTILLPANAEWLRRCTQVVYLRCDPWTLAHRAEMTGESDRPILVGGDPCTEAFIQFADRDALYRATCHVLVDGSGEVEQVARSIVDRLGSVPHVVA